MHPKLRNFSAVASNSSRTIAIDILNKPVELNWLGDASIVLKAGGKKVEVIGFVTFAPSGSLLAEAKRLGIGIISLDQGKPNLILDPDYNKFLVSDIKSRITKTVGSINLRCSTKHSFKLFNEKAIERSLA
ncbi:MAG: hypothetical protein ACREBJ_07190, partial [Nitrosotalea sp.]